MIVTADISRMSPACGEQIQPQHHLLRNTLSAALTALSCSSSCETSLATAGLAAASRVSRPSSHCSMAPPETLSAERWQCGWAVFMALNQWVVLLLVCDLTKHSSRSSNITERHGDSEVELPRRLWSCKMELLV